MAVAASGACSHRRVSTPALDSSARLEERKQRSVTEDPAFKGETPDGWLVPAESVPPRQAAQATAVDPKSGEQQDSEIGEFAERLKNTKPPQIFQGELAPGASRTVGLQLIGPSGLVGKVQWIGTAAAMQVTMAFNASPLTSGTAYRVGTSAGGSYLKAQAPAAGRATLVVKNTSNANVRIRMLLVATSR